VNSRFVIGALLALLVAGAISAAVVLGLGSDGSEPASEPRDSSEPIAMATSLSPPTHRIGDLVVARLEVAVDPRRVDPELVVVRAQFTPYELARDVEIARRHAGDLVVVEYSYALQCLSSDCLTDESPGQIELPQAGVSYVQRDTKLGVDTQTPWPTATLVARTGDGAGSVPAEATLGALPEATYAIDTRVLRGLAIGLAALLLAAVLVWALIRLRPSWGRHESASEAPTDTDPLADALAQLEEARGESPTSQRLALEELANALDSVDNRELAPLARRLAWASGVPDPADVEALALAARDLQEAL
jgi:hypothetical protein